MTGVMFKNARVVRSGWLEEGGRRLDCNPYMSGALEARDKLRRLSARKDKLISLTHGHAGGIYNGPMFKRNYVESPKYGVPFLSSGTMLLADLGTLPLLRRRDAESSRLSYLKLTRGTTLISCSGTIGRMCYVRPDMEGFWSSQDVLKVVPDPSSIAPGYLHAFLTSTYGVPLVVAGTYGAIIQHIEPEHIADLPVPRFGDDFESKVAELVDQAASLRTVGSALRRKAIAIVEDALGWTAVGARLQASVVASSDALRRMDAFHHSLGVRAGTSALRAAFGERLADLAHSVFEPNRGSRLKVTDPAYGVPLLSSSAVFETNPTGEYLISRSRTPQIESLLFTDADVLLPRSGQLGGIIGRAVLPRGRNIGHAGSEHLVRVRCHTKNDAGYLWAVLAAEPGYLAVTGTAYGSSIPSLDTGLIGELCVPWLPEHLRVEIADLVLEALKAQDEGTARELAAVALVEEKINEGA
jgi:type I restriction enzyme S subunit